jgi:hypothetical protein
VNNVAEVGASTGAWDWKLWVPLLGVLVTVVVTTIYGLNTTRRNLRANILGTSRLKFLEVLRDEVANLLIHGERFYSGRHAHDTDALAAARDELLAASKRLVVLLGREDDLRMEMAEAVRKFAEAPSEDQVDTIEFKSQEIFRQQWDKVRTETGHKARKKEAQPRPGAAAP